MLGCKVWAGLPKESLMQRLHILTQTPTETTGMIMKDMGGIRVISITKSMGFLRPAALIWPFVHLPAKFLLMKNCCG